MSHRQHMLMATALTVSVLGAVRVASAEELRIGAVFPLTGTYGSYGKGLTAGLNIALDEVNAAGGVLGTPVKLLIEDDQTDATAGLNAAKKVVDVEKANIIVGTFASSVTLPILSYTTQVGIPVLTLSGAPEISDIGKKTGLVYRFVSTEGMFGQGYALYAAKSGYKKAYLLAANNAAQLDAAKNFAERFAKEGQTVLGTTIFEPSQPSYRSELDKALATDPDVIMVAAYTNDAITIAKTLYQLAPDVRIVGPLYSLNSDYIKALGDKAVEGTLALDAMSAEDSPAYKRVAPLYSTAVGEDPTSNPYAVMDYDMVITASLAATAAGSTDPAKFVPFIAKVADAPGVKVTSYAEGLTALKAGNDIDYDGASSPVDFNDHGDLTSMFMRTFVLTGGKAEPKDTIAP